LPIGRRLTTCPILVTKPRQRACLYIPTAILAFVTIPRWRGFNLIDLIGRAPRRRFRESDFEWIAAWGFNFVRLPLSFLNWSDKADWFAIREKNLRPIDEALKFGQRYGIHVNINFHEIPGYRVNSPERAHLFLFGNDEDLSRRALEAAAHHWSFFATRYRDIPSSRLSFNLINEPPVMVETARYERVIQRLVSAIREVDPDRLIFADGADLGQSPLLGLVDTGLVQSTRGYLPKALSHYRATWVPDAEFESVAPPTWPLLDRNRNVWDRERLRSELIMRWRPVTERGVNVHVGEWGAYCATPHRVVLDWMRDVLSLWRESGWGWALWRLHGEFGIVDSQRRDVRDERFHRRRLDREMLELLQAG